MEVLVYANQQQLGPFTPETVADMARMGSLPAEAMVWHEGVSEWYPLTGFLEQHAPGTPVTPPPVEEPPVAPVRSTLASLNPPQIGGDGIPSSASCIVRGVAAGFGVALVGGMLWLGASVMVGFRIPFVGLGIGWLVGTMTARAARNEASVILPVSAVLWTFLACAPFTVGIYSLLGLLFACYWAWRTAAE